MIRSKHLCHSAIILAMASSVYAQVTVFQDTFDRPSNSDIDASSLGMSGLLAPLTYYERTDDDVVSNANFTNIDNNQLQLADGPNASALNPVFNFFSPVTHSLSFSLDLVSNNGTASDGIQRFVGFGFGATEAEANSIGFDHNATASVPGWKGNQSGSTAGSGVADFFVAWERNNNSSQNNFGTISIWKNGIRALTFNNGGSLFEIGSTLQVDLAIPSFDAGETVSADVYYGGNLVTTDTFQWDNSNSNYMGIAGRQNSAGWSVDNFVVEADAFKVVTLGDPTLTIDRDTGNVTFSNPTTDPLDIVGYTLETNGGFDLDEWNNQSVLDVDLTSGTNPSQDLSEGTFGASGVLINAIDGLLDFGDVWIASPFEEMTLQLLTADNTFVPVTVEFIGNNDMAFALGDFDVDGLLDPEDWDTLRLNYNTIADQLGVLAYRYEGDMNLDGVIDDADMALFAAAYDAVNGPGSFDLLPDVPEPSSLMLFSLVVLGRLIRRRA